MAASASITRRILGDFVVGDKLGEGGHGAVYRAEQRGLGREAVIKVLHARAGASEGLVQRFLREARLASRLDHPFAAHVYAFGAEPDGLLWIAMELVRGTTLRKVLDAQPGGRLALARLVPLLDGLCEVVHTAHEQGIVHRDLKPDNVMVLARAGRLLPKLLDLGVAKLVTAPAARSDGLDETSSDPGPTTAPDPLAMTQVGAPTAGTPEDAALASASDPAITAPATATAPAPAASPTPIDDFAHDTLVTQAGAMLGSPHYMAPEQWRDGGQIDARTDLYALGVVAYEMIAGRLPFPGGTLGEIARGHLRGEIPALPEDAPTALTAVLARALAKRPADRYPSALAFAEAVRAAAGLRISAEALPRLDDELRAELAWLPQPIADAVAELEAARNPHQARDALWAIVRVSARWLGVISLCARSRTTAQPGDDPAVAAALRELHRRELDDAEWLDLVRTLARPFADIRDAHPIPELVELALVEPSPFEPLLALHAAEASATSEESLRDRLARTLPVLAPLLHALGFLAAYPVIVPRSDDSGELWMGPRRSARPVIAVVPGLPAGEPVLADLDGRPVLQLAPLVQVAAPSPGAPSAHDELFVLAGPGRIAGHGARLVAEPHGLERHDEAVWNWLRSSLLADGAAGAPTAEHAPYRGLAAFTEADAGAFFGREHAVTALVNQLRGQPLLAVVGPSGAGKSSFLRAGVIPALPPGWRAVVLRPGASPIAALAARVDPAELASPATGETLVIVVDQLEELFTLCPDRTERERFAAELARLARSADLPIRVVLALRDDFLARTGELAALRDRLARAVTLLATPAEADLVRAIVEPARRAGYELDPGLARRMVDSVAGRPGALALLSFTALRLWELRDRHFRRLTLAAYDAIGGVEGALARHAEDTLQTCTAEEQRLVRLAFRQLVTAEGTRAVVTRDELGDVLGNAPAARAALDRLIDARLVVIAEGDAGAERVEIIHEALLAAWPRLVQWRREDADGARLRDQLRAAARQWHDRDRPRGLLWRDDALDDYLRWRTRWPAALPELDRAFGDASVHAATRARRVRRGLAATAAAILIAGLIGLALLYRSSQHSAAVARTALIDSLVQQAQKELFGGDYLAALPLLARAYAAGDRSLAVRIMLHRALALAEHPRVKLQLEILNAAFRPGGTSVLAIGYAGDAAVIDAATGRVTAHLAGPAHSPGTARNAAISRDGALAAFARSDRIELWDGTTSRALAIGHVDPEVTTLVAFDADHTHLATANARTVALWRIANGALVWSQPAPGPAHQLLAITGGVVVATLTSPTEVARNWLVSDTGVRELGAAPFLAGVDGDHFVTIEPERVVRRDASGAIASSYETAHVRSAVVSHDGKLVALGLIGGSIELLDVATGRRRGILVGHTGAVHAMDFTVDDSRLVSMALDGTARIWDVAHARELFHYVGLAGTPMAVHVAGVTGLIAAASSEAVVIVPVADPSAKLTVQLPELLGEARFAAEGTRIVALTSSGVGLWDSATGARLEYITCDVNDGAHASPDLRYVAVPRAERPEVEIRELHGGTVHAVLHSAGLVWWAVFDHRGARIATANAAGLIELWTVDGARLATLRGHTAVLGEVEFSRDDRRLVSASNDRTARVWDIASGRELVRVTHDDEVDAAKFGPGDTTFATASADKLAGVWDAATGAAIRSFRHEAAVRSVGITNDLVAGATSSGAVQLWDMATGREAARFHHAAIAVAVDFDRDRMLTTGGDGRMVIWDVSATIGSPDEVLAAVCALPEVDPIAKRDQLRCAREGRSD